MNPSIEMMLNRYEINSVSDRENALKEILQEISLAAFIHYGDVRNWNKDFFKYWLNKITFK